VEGQHALEARIPRARDNIGLDTRRDAQRIAFQCRLFTIAIPGKFLIVADTDHTDLGAARSAWL